ncbi:O-antigen ligase family protein [Metabacillus idriensis]|uniref:O-antigen ligase family protein n=1 Tax=Metabacillus idriensis TaxID=324768 RepID=UPI00203FC093|nr:O-antigen ligase family protein [Metabacillus idriensis]MCM3597508.1 O-antigen ligase family protein [Metabacillus idriensis]
MNIKRVSYFDYLFFLLFLLMASWSAFNEWLPKRIILNFVYFYFLARIILNYFQKKIYVSYNSFLVVIICFISIFWSEFPIISLKFSVYLFFETLIMIYMANTYHYREVLKIFFISGLIITILSYVVAVFLPELGIDQLKHIGSWEGVFTHKNNLAETLSFYIIIGLFILIKEEKVKCKIFYYAIFISQVLLIILSKSTTGLILLAVTILLTVFLILFNQIRNIYLKASMTVFSIGLLMSLLTILIIYISEFLNIFGKDTTFTGRNIIWEAGLKLISFNWFEGYGYRTTIIEGSYFYNYFISYINFNVWTLHNGYLETISYIGIMGVITIVYGLSIYLFRSIRLFTYNNSKDITNFLPISFLIYMLILNTQESAFIGSEFSLIWCFYVYIHVYLKTKGTLNNV